MALQWLKAGALCAALLVGLLWPFSVQAQGRPLPWDKAPNFESTLERKELRDLLREFTASYGVTAVVDPDLKGTVSGRFALTPQTMLEYLAATFGFTWFYDGTVLYLTPLEKIVSEVVPLPSQSTERTLKSLSVLGLNDPRFPLSVDPATRVAKVTGPQPYVDLVRNALTGMDTSAGESDDAVIRIFRLRHAFAGDQQVDRNSASTVPGVTAILRRLFPSNGGAGGAAFAPSPAPFPAGTSGRANRQVPVPGTNLRVPETRLPNEQDARRSMGGSDAPARPGKNLPQFEADTRLNAIVVRDIPAHMALYEELIKSLDVRPVVVEIEARIIEVSTDEFESLGLDWRFSSGRLDIQAGRGPLPGLNAGTALQGGGPPFAGSNGSIGLLGQRLSSGVVASTVLTDAGRTLIARINALQQTGKGSVLASPRVLTLDNIEAVIEDTQTFYVRVASERDAGLFQVNSGTSLRVKPLVIEEDGRRQMKLAIQIDDGAPTQATVDGIPIVRSTTIGTWAYVNENQSLLIGGFTQEQKSNGETGVPVLSSLPVIGNLFKTRENKQMFVQRLFMLTPRVVELGYGG